MIELAFFLIFALWMENAGPGVDDFSLTRRTTLLP